MSPGDLRFTRDDRRVLCYESDDMLCYHEVKGAIILLAQITALSTMWKVLASGGVMFMTIGELMTRTRIGERMAVQPGDLIWVVNARVSQSRMRLNYTGPLIILEIDEEPYTDSAGKLIIDAQQVSMLSSLGVVSGWTDYLAIDIVKE